MVTILILIDGFLQLRTGQLLFNCFVVTILILIDGFLQLHCSLKDIDTQKMSQSLF